VGGVHDRVREQMRTVYAGDTLPRYLDARAQDLLAEGRAAFQRLGLGERSIVSAGREVYLFPWSGDAVVHTLGLSLRARGFEAEVLGPVLKVTGTQVEVEAALRVLVAAGPGRAEALTAEVANMALEKHDGFVPPELLARDYAARHLDVQGAWRAAQRLL
jgi:ATP-dependent Lhr-like helicase